MDNDKEKVVTDYHRSKRRGAVQFNQLIKVCAVNGGDKRTYQVIIDTNININIDIHAESTREDNTHHRTSGVSQHD